MKLSDLAPKNTAGFLNEDALIILEALINDFERYQRWTGRSVECVHVLKSKSTGV